MRYSIQGDTLPVVVCELDAGEKIITEEILTSLDKN